jgi:alpha-glucosidase
VGDLPGLISRLDHLARLGVDGLWCSPIMVSPNRDMGYDVADYFDVQPAYGTLDDVRRLVAEARRRGLRVLLDLVPNHTSDRHPWFSDPARRDWYVWRLEPNNWIANFGGPAWTYDAGLGRWYLHSYLPEQPDLNWWHPEVRRAFDEILDFWLDLGIAGFRIDAAHVIVKDAMLRDNPPAGPDDDRFTVLRGQRYLYNQCRPEVHEVLRRWRRLADRRQPPAVLLGETHVQDLSQLAAFYGRGDELHLALNFAFALSPFDAPSLREIVERTLERLQPLGATPVWHASNHDLPRFPTRWCEGDRRRIELALTLLLTLPGTCILYQGDELGMVDTRLPPGVGHDPVGRDRARTPMPWNDGPNRGFTSGRPWLPLDEATASVAQQEADPGSVLALTRRLIALRRSLGPYRPGSGSGDSWSFWRGDTRIQLDFASPSATILSR